MKTHELNCDICFKPFSVNSKKAKELKYLKRKRNYHVYCSQNCKESLWDKRIEVSCKNCAKPFLKFYRECRKSPNHFCSRSCSTTFKNLNKTHGTRRSKLEKWLEFKLTELYQNLEIHFNRKDAINSELDIYIPNLKIAFELNGIFHYEPIYGADKLSQIQNNDNRKFQACLEHDIELCIIDTSKFSYFKEEGALKFLTIITNLVNYKLSNLDRVEVL